MQGDRFLKRRRPSFDGADDDDDGTAQWAARVQLFTEASELDVEVVQLVEYFQKVADGACDAIARPHQDHIEAAAAGIGHKLVETWPAGFGSGDLVGIPLDDLQIALPGQLLQVVQAGFPGADPKSTP